MFDPSISLYISLPVHVHTAHAIYVVAMEPTPCPPHAWLKLYLEVSFFSAVFYLLFLYSELFLPQHYHHNNCSHNQTSKLNNKFGNLLKKKDQ